jgi:putative Mn2+ efflux pump MntP
MEGIIEQLNKLIRWCSGAIFVFMGVRFIWNALNSNGNIIEASASGNDAL